ncbi:hypothetical protein [Amycolatopsis sp. NBC_01480]|uniref:hypothetical protein n=1 Tax=Amycolatopsis sp. NBC_01480 TaxID=2903562 RepID=UPI002E2971C9|nr:hypothetical protein [Amycolatopsis sp. NBC_01480]
MVTLEVPGRRSPLTQVVLDGQRFLVSLAGEPDWVGPGSRGSPVFRVAQPRPVDAE